MNIIGKNILSGMLLLAIIWLSGACEKEQNADSVSVRIQNNTVYMLQDVKVYSIAFGNLTDGEASEYKTPPDEGRDPLIQFVVNNQKFIHYIPTDIPDGSHTYKVDSVDFDAALVFVSHDVD